MEQWKEYISIDSITLIVAIATLIVTILSFIYTKRNNKKRIKNLISIKEAQLKVMEQNSRYGLSASEAGGIRGQIAALRAEIEQLKQQI